MQRKNSTTAILCTNLVHDHECLVAGLEDESCSFFQYELLADAGPTIPLPKRDLDSDRPNDQAVGSWQRMLAAMPMWREYWPRRMGQIILQIVKIRIQVFGLEDIGIPMMLSVFGKIIDNVITQLVHTTLFTRQAVQ